METKGIIISQKEYERLTELEKNFNDKVKENKDTFKKGLEDAIKGNLVKLLWVKDKCYAEIMGCDLSEDGVCNFIRKEDADMLASVRSEASYDRNDVLKDNAKKGNAKRVKDHKDAFGLYQEVISNQKKVIRNLWWAFGIMFVSWLVQLILYIAK
jgi:hypothetical protein